MLNIMENNSLCSRIYLTIALFFLVTASNGYACTPRGHVKFHNHTKIPITVTVFRAEDPFSDRRKKCLENARKNKKGKVTDCYVKSIISNIIVVKPGKTTSGICWAERFKHGVFLSLKKRMKSFTTSFKYNNHEVSGPGGKVDFQFQGFHTSDYMTKIGKHTGDKSVITFSGCNHKRLICTVNFKMNEGKKNK